MSSNLARKKRMAAGSTGSYVYVRLAFENLKNNRRTYVPYILTGVLTVMMYYNLEGLSKNSYVGEDGALASILDLAVKVILIFAVIFLFYTNSFLMKRRKKEIGVYNILGMGKGHIARMLAIETGIMAVVCIVSGVVLGIIFSKLMYLVLLKFMRYEVRIGFEISTEVFMHTVLLFVMIFLLTLIYNLAQMKQSSPAELLRGGNQGESEPKTRWLLTIFGIAALGTGYGIALTVESPMTALMLFFVAVVCVILGTYALYTAGSIALLKRMRKNKKFYYQAKHFTAVSGMIYRMKQNAVGLANICILSTMVLIMVSTSVSLYVGMEDVLRTRFPVGFEATVSNATPESEQALNEILVEELEKAGVAAENWTEYHLRYLAAIEKEDGFDLAPGTDYSSTDVCELYLIPAEDYCRIEEINIDLAEDEVYLYCGTGSYGQKTVRLGQKTWQMAKKLESLKIASEEEYAPNLVDVFYVILPNTEQILDVIQDANATMGITEEEGLSGMAYRVTFDPEGEEEDCIQAMESIQGRLWSEIPYAGCEGRELGRKSFYSLYGGLLFIGIYLGSLFLMATVLIIYYKQISEGYDDRERYQIMQKVGMSKQEVRRSIRSQIRMVFFLPLVTAVIHIAVAFKVITKLLAALNLTNVRLFFGCTVVTVAVFAVFYGIVFALTAREYYRIVN